MICEKCKKNTATMHMHTVINGVSRERHLCGFCAAAEGYMGKNQDSLVNMLAQVFGESINAKPPAGDLRCRCCGSSFSDIAERGKAGCSECYKTFRGQLMPSLGRLHGRTKHVGKIPANASKEIKKTTRLRELREELDTAVAAEEFEKAAKIRDEIKDLEG